MSIKNTADFLFLLLLFYFLNIKSRNHNLILLSIDKFYYSDSQQVGEYRKYKSPYTLHTSESYKRHNTEECSQCKITVIRCTHCKCNKVHKHYYIVENYFSKALTSAVVTFKRRSDEQGSGNRNIKCQYCGICIYISDC